MDNVKCPACGSRRTEWLRRDLRYVIRCGDCEREFEPPPQLQIARAVEDCRRAVEGRKWSSIRADGECREL